jgi:hypothetical protein
VVDAQNRGGSGIFANGQNVNLTLNTVSLINNQGYQGGGLCFAGNTLSVQNCNIIGNQAVTEGGGIYLALPPCNATISGSFIYGNSAGTDGGGISISPSVVSVAIFNTLIRGNGAGGNGGGINNAGAPLSMSGGELDHNTATGNGGGYYNKAGNPTFTNVNITGNNAAKGGGVYIRAGVVTFNNGKISGNHATNLGNGICYVAGSSFSLNGTIITDDYKEDPNP